MRHGWDKPHGEFERACRRCPAVIRKYAGEGGYQYWPQGLDYHDKNGQVWAQWLQTIPPCEPPVLPAANRFRYGAKVRINYSGNPVVPYRYGYVREDAGGPKVRVAWRAADGPEVARNVVAWHGTEHIQWIPRDRLEAAA